MKLVYDRYETPFGPIHVILDSKGVREVVMTPAKWEQCLGDPALTHDPPACREAVSQLDEYFSGKRRRFSLPLSLTGTSFQQNVWRELQEIPFGETRSYQAIARAIAAPGSCRAVGQANRRNPLPIFVPCHRVIGKDGSLTGYIGTGYLDIKSYLLRMEQAYLKAM
ncbi:methylated-DNA-[protein]-cysteine S-methyltransferase [Hydrogenispora ethanolica]|uniref:Methylated-DNA--protein-cysteine methyltransferase n=1 Tax=Hydrogenispora ethanolica TaxID=1082276 RepID=A0A4R1RYD8_HYDET|nr:methylated-DNA--[protein]-cysteine S-methyltransferase [Hydrogenispora ethanolica]TCL71589.1 methylated-DNA-[protein]-cysteine S-methyltransferase [Hydrogenispora ethanolica]